MHFRLQLMQSWHLRLQYRIGTNTDIIVINEKYVKYISKCYFKKATFEWDKLFS